MENRAFYITCGERLCSDHSIYIRCKSIGCTHGISVWTMEPNPNARWITENVQRRNLFRNCLIATEGTKEWHTAIVLDRACENRFEKGICAMGPET